MGLTSEITADIQDAFDTDLSDAVSVITYNDFNGAPTYDPASGVVTAPITTHATEGVVSIIDKRMIDGEIFKAGDYAVLILFSQLSITPAIGESMTIAGEKHSIYAVEHDPASVAWTLYTRVT